HPSAPASGDAGDGRPFREEGRVGLVARSAALTGTATTGHDDLRARRRSALALLALLIAAVLVLAAAVLIATRAFLALLHALDARIGHAAGDELDRADGVVV